MEGAGTQSRENLDQLPTEAGGSADAEYELRPTVELVELMSAAEEAVPAAVRASAREIATAIDAIAERLARGGRLLYVGAGTSGRLAALDADESVATFGATPGQVVAMAVPDEAEDDRTGGAESVRTAGVDANDAVVGISASGRTPYVLGAVEAAAEAGGLTAALTCVADSELGRLADHPITIVVGPEFIAGSTRLKAGTAQKLVLNAISTITMIRLGKTFGNLMVDVTPANDKLRARVRRIVLTATGASPDEVETALEAADGDAKVAIVSILGSVDADTARARLAAASGNVRLSLRP